MRQPQLGERRQMKAAPGEQHVESNNKRTAAGEWIERWKKREPDKA